MRCSKHYSEPQLNAFGPTARSFRRRERSSALLYVHHSRLEAEHTSAVYLLRVPAAAFSAILSPCGWTRESPAVNQSVFLDDPTYLYDDKSDYVDANPS